MGKQLIFIVIVFMFVSALSLFAGIPTITSATTDDVDGDGYIDRIYIQFSENVIVIDGDNTDGLDCLSVSGYTIANSDYGATNVTSLDLILVEGGNYDTDATPDITYNQGGTTHIISISTLDEMSDGYNFSGTQDKAPPAFSSIVTGDSDKNGHIDRITLQFSEDVTINDAGGSGDGLDCITVNGYTIVSSDYSGTVTKGMDFVLNLMESGSYDTGVKPSVSYTTSGNSDIVDSVSNEMLNGETETTVDGAAPIITGNSETVDNNRNGMIDHYKLTFSESMDDSTFGGFFISGHSISGIDIIGDSADDDIIYISINETGYDTGDTPDITTSSSTFSDISGNNLNGGVDYGTGDINEIDKAPPAFSSIVTGDSDRDGHIDRITLQFSEDVTINDAGGSGDGLDCINVTGYTIVFANYSGTITKGTDFVLNLVESGSYDTGVTPAVSYNTSGSSDIVDSVSNEMLNGETETTVDGAASYMLTATFHDPDSNDIDQGDYISIEFDEPVKLNCTDSTDFVLLNGAYGDTFGTGSYLEDSNPGDNCIEIVLGNNPHLILPDIWSAPGENMPSGIGIKTGGTTCVADLADNPASDTPEVDIGGSGSNEVAMVIVTDGADIFTDPGSDATFIDTDISVSITLGYDALYVALWYDIGKNPDGSGSQNITDKKVLATGSGKSWKAVIPGADPDIKQGANVRFILNIDGVNYYSDGSESAGGKTPWSFYIIYEQKDRVTIRNNMINPKRGDLVYINYYLTEKKNVRIAVYDLAGDRVKLLKNKGESSGSHLVTWNGKNQKGQNCIPGLYYILIKIDKTRYVKKVLVIK